mmetsp:Transcript_2282/g.7558  ORF Transcript_2282/g.7558 Transcript_2282/m.7558 type:complete len:202 (-) Transcript_2282:322-927(-)
MTSIHLRNARASRWKTNVDTMVKRLCGSFSRTTWRSHASRKWRVHASQPSPRRRCIQRRMTRRVRSLAASTRVASRRAAISIACCSLISATLAVFTRLVHVRHAVRRRPCIMSRTARVTLSAAEARAELRQRVATSASRPSSSSCWSRSWREYCSSISANFRDRSCSRSSERSRAVSWVAAIAASSSAWPSAVAPSLVLIA